jgi:hypothetical protein
MYNVYALNIECVDPGTPHKFCVDKGIFGLWAWPSFSHFGLLLLKKKFLKKRKEVIKVIENDT